MKRARIGILYPSHTAPANFEMLEHFCEVITASLINGEALNIRAHAPQVDYGREVGQEMGMGRKEGETRALKSNVGKKVK